MVAGLSRALCALDYPLDRLQIIFALEADDIETIAAVALAHPPCATEVVIAPEDGPKTKPRACNAALRRANGKHVVIFDAEDRPDRRQLREAASRFALADNRLACLQAPLRIIGARNFLERQFALEYAAQFEVMLPAFARLGAPFPLGGTSNHFRRAALIEIGGWDAYNVTEDADIGFRLAVRGYRSGVLRAPTWEEAPDSFFRWRPQRTRWVKGYMQTWGVHMRTPLAGGFAKFLALQLTLGLAIVSAAAHGPLGAIMLIALTVGAFQGRFGLSLPDAALLISGWATAVLSMWTGSRRAGGLIRITDALAAPLYWMLQSFAAVCAILQLIHRPHHWSKTVHSVRRSSLAAILTAALDEPILGGVRRVRDAIP